MVDNSAEKENIAATKIDLEQYFSRIHYDGDRSPTLKTLQAIHLLHPQYIPFENLNPLLRIPVRLDISSLQNKILVEGRGGYCFEQNLLLKAVLEAMGYKVKGLAARVLWGRPADAITARGHMLLLIEIDSIQYIADVGFGGQTLTSPLVLKAGLEQQTPHEPFRLVQTGDEHRLETLVSKEWKSVYRFSLQENFLVDYDVTSWYLSNYPDSHFVRGLIAARVDNDRRYALRNNQLAVHYLDGETERTMITDTYELRNVLSRTFGITIPETENLQATLQKILDSASG